MSQQTIRNARPMASPQTERVADAGRDVASTAVGQGQKVASTAVRQGHDVASTAVERGQEVASTAVDKSQEVARLATRDVRELAGSLKAEAADVTDELWAQTRQLARETRGQVQDQAESQTQRLAQTLGRLSEEVRALAEGRPEEAPTVGNYVSSTADRLDSLAQQIKVRGAEGLVGDLEDFARRKPGPFMVGAVIAGFGLGRILKAAKSEAEDDEGAPPLAARTRSVPANRLASAGAG